MAFSITNLCSEKTCCQGVLRVILILIHMLQRGLLLVKVILLSLMLNTTMHTKLQIHVVTQHLLLNVLCILFLALQCTNTHPNLINTQGLYGSVACVVKLTIVNFSQRLCNCWSSKQWPGREPESMITWTNTLFVIQAKPWKSIWRMWLHIMCMVDNTYIWCKI